jgi:RNA polymerase sigma-70 factor (ECF subfamily)
MTEQTDEELAGQVQSGNKAVFSQLITRYEEKLTRYARRFLSDSEDVRDVVQDIFIKTYVNIQAFDNDRRFSPWIYRIAHNELVNVYKKRKRERLSYVDLEVVFPFLRAKEKTDTEVRDAETKKLLEHGLEKINPKYREALVLFYFEELSYQDIADILKIPIATVGVWIKRGKDALKKHLSPLV